MTACKSRASRLQLFFGGVLSFIGFELMVEWLFESKEKVRLCALDSCDNLVSGLQLLKLEFVIVWCTFLAINFLGLELGANSCLCVASYI